MNDLVAALEGDRSPGLYRFNSEIDVDQLATLAQEHNWQFYYIDGKLIQNKADFFRLCAIELRFPDYFGQNWDAFEDCIRDLEETSANRYILLFEQPDEFAQNHPEEWATALSIFEEAVEFWQASDTPMYVLFRSSNPVVDELDSLTHDS